MKRAWRRHHLARMKVKAKMVGELHGIPGNWDKEYDHLAVCSCHLCRNPRRSRLNSGSSVLTMQERKHYEGNGG